MKHRAKPLDLSTAAVKLMIALAQLASVLEKLIR